MAAIKFCVKNQINVTKTFEIVRKAYGETSESRTIVLNRRYKNGQLKTLKTIRGKDGHYSMPSVFVNCLRRLNLRLLAETLNISFGSVREIVCNWLQKKVQRVRPKI